MRCFAAVPAWLRRSELRRLTSTQAPPPSPPFPHHNHHHFLTGVLAVELANCPASMMRTQRFDISDFQYLHTKVKASGGGGGGHGGGGGGHACVLQSRPHESCLHTDFDQLMTCMYVLGEQRTFSQVPPPPPPPRPPRRRRPPPPPTHPPPSPPPGDHHGGLEPRIQAALCGHPQAGSSTTTTTTTTTTTNSRGEPSQTSYCRFGRPGIRAGGCGGGGVVVVVGGGGGGASVRRHS